MNSMTEHKNRVFPKLFHIYRICLEHWVKQMKSFVTGSNGPRDSCFPSPQRLPWETWVQRPADLCPLALQLRSSAATRKELSGQVGVGSGGALVALHCPRLRLNFCFCHLPIGGPRQVVLKSFFFQFLLFVKGWSYLEGILWSLTLKTYCTYSISCRVNTQQIIYFFPTSFQPPYILNKNVAWQKNPYTFQSLYPLPGDSGRAFLTKREGW